MRFQICCNVGEARDEKEDIALNIGCSGRKPNGQRGFCN